MFNLDRRTFLVTFQNRTQNSRFIFQDAIELKKILEEYNYSPVESLKELEVVSGKFKRVSKAEFLRFASWETEAMEFFKNHYFFKK